MADSSNFPLSGPASDVSADAQPWLSGQPGYNSLSGSLETAPVSRNTAFSDCSSKQPEPCGFKYHGVFVHHKEEGRTASMIMKKLKKHYPDLRLKLYGDLQSTGVYGCVEKACREARNIIELWTPKYEDDKHCMDMSGSIKTQKSFAQVSDCIFIVHGFSDGREPTEERITFNDTMPVYSPDDDDFYTTLKDRLLGDQNIEEITALQLEIPQPVPRQEPAADLPWTSDTCVKGVVQEGMLPGDVTSDTSLQSTQSLTSRTSSGELLKKQQPAIDYHEDSQTNSSETEDGTPADSSITTKAVSSDEGEPQESCEERVPDVRSGTHQPLTLLSGTGEAEGHINTARSPLALQQTEGGAGKTADTGFSAVPPQPGDDSRQDSQSREGTSPAEGQQKEGPQPVQRDTEAAPHPPRSVQDAASQKNPSTSLDSAPVCSDPQMNASKSQEASSASENVTFVYNVNLNPLVIKSSLNSLATNPSLNLQVTNPSLNLQATNPPLNTLATQGDCGDVASGRQHSPSVANTTSRDNQMQESGDSAFSQTKDAAPNYVLTNAPSCIKTIQQTSNQGTLPLLQNSHDVDADQNNVGVGGTAPVLEETAEEDTAVIGMSLETSLSEETDAKEPLSIDYSGQRINADVEREIKHEALTKEEKPGADDDGGFKTRSQDPLQVSQTEAFRQQSEKPVGPVLATHPVQRSFQKTQDVLSQLPFIDSEDELLHRTKGILHVPYTENSPEKQRSREEGPSVKPRTDRTSTECSKISLSSVKPSAGFEAHPDDMLDQTLHEEYPQNQLLSREGDAECFKPLQGPMFPPRKYEFRSKTLTLGTPIQESQACTNQPHAADSDAVSDQVSVSVEHSCGHHGAKFVAQSTMTSQPPTPEKTTIVNVKYAEYLHIAHPHDSSRSSSSSSSSRPVIHQPVQQAPQSAGPPEDSGITPHPPESPAPSEGQGAPFPRRRGIFKYLCCGVRKRKKQTKRGKRNEDME